MQGDFHDAERLIREGAAIDFELGREVVGTMAAAELLGDVGVLAGDLALAERELRRGYDRLLALGERGYASTLAGALAGVLFEVGRVEEAEEMAQSCKEAADPDDVVSQVLWRTASAGVLASHRKPEEAEALAREAVAIAEGTDHLNMRADALSCLAYVLDASGKAQEADVTREGAARLYERKGNVVACRRAEAARHE